MLTLGQVVELYHVVARDLLADAVGHLAEILLDVAARIGPDAVRMRIVGAPDDVVLADQRNDWLEELILLVRGVALTAEVVAGLHREAEGPRAVIVFGVEPVEHVRQPGDAGLAADAGELGITLA